MHLRYHHVAILLLSVAFCVACGRAAEGTGQATQSGAAVIWSQPIKAGGELIPASWKDPGASETDRFVWENFGFENAQTISEVRWRGGYDPALNGSGGAVVKFSVDIYTSIPAGSEPDLAQAPLVHYIMDGNAEETPAGDLNGVPIYDYRFVLPEYFEAEPATTYWIQIQAFQYGDPDWGLVTGSGTLGDGRHFRSTAYGYYYQLVLEDIALEFLAPVVGGVAPVAEVAASAEDIAAILANLPPPEVIPVNAEGVQEVVLVVSRSGYTPLHFSVQAGVPVRLVFRQLGYVPGGNELFVRWGENQQTYLILSSPTDTKTLDFTPQEPGEFRFSCPHDWYEGVMTVQS
ncbi:MAG: cupredoxin domain-containing protein [Anaerolineae bacterium]